MLHLGRTLFPHQIASERHPRAYRYNSSAKQVIEALPLRQRAAKTQCSDPGGSTMLVQPHCPASCHASWLLQPNTPTYLLISNTFYDFPSLSLTSTSKLIPKPVPLEASYLSSLLTTSRIPFQKPLCQFLNTFRN